MKNIILRTSTLTDGSKVYNVELHELVYGRDNIIEFAASDWDDALKIVSYLERICIAAGEEYKLAED